MSTQGLGLSAKCRDCDSTSTRHKQPRIAEGREIKSFRSWQKWAKKQCGVTRGVEGSFLPRMGCRMQWNHSPTGLVLNLDDCCLECTQKARGLKEQQAQGYGVKASEKGDRYTIRKECWEYRGKRWHSQMGDLAATEGGGSHQELLYRRL